MRYVFVLILLAGCSAMPTHQTPEQCRAHGVAVHDGDTVTGKVIESEFKWIGTGALSRACGGDYGMDACAVGVTEPWPDPNHEYNIFYADPRLAEHEYCHAVYEQWNHTVEFNLATMQNRPGTGNTKHWIIDHKS